MYVIIFSVSFSRLTHGNNVPDTNRESRVGRCAGSGAAGVGSPKIEVLVLQQVQNRSVFVFWFSSRRDIMTSRTADGTAERRPRAQPTCLCVQSEQSSAVSTSDMSSVLDNSPVGEKGRPEQADASASPPAGVHTGMTA